MTIMKKSLKTYVDKYNDLCDDITIIRQYIIDNDLESEYIKLLTELTSSKTNKLEIKRNATNFIISSSTMTLEYLLKTYPKDIALFLLDLELCYAQIFDFSPKLIEKAKEIIPTINTPKAYFNDLVVHLNVQYGIQFKDHVKGRYESYFSRPKELEV